MSMGSLSQGKFHHPPEPNPGQVLIRPSFPTGCQIRQLDRLWLSKTPALIDLLQVITGFFRYANQQVNSGTFSFHQ